MFFNVNASEVVVLTNKLEKLHRSALPLAVRGALNGTAFRMKQKTLIETTNRVFTNRAKTFFKANSTVKRADGWNVDSMYSEVAMTSNKLRGGNNYAVQDLWQQEKGGNIGGRSFIPISSGARVSGRYQKNVKSKKRIGIISQVIDARNSKGKNNKEKFVKASIAAGVGGFVMSADTISTGARIVYEIRSIKKVGGRTVVKQIPVYSYLKGRLVKVNGTGFMQLSATKAAKNLPSLYQREAERQIKRLMR